MEAYKEQLNSIENEDLRQLLDGILSHKLTNILERHEWINKDDQHKEVCISTTYDSEKVSFHNTIRNGGKSFVTTRIDKYQIKEFVIEMNNYDISMKYTFIEGFNNYNSYFFEWEILDENRKAILISGVEKLYTQNRKSVLDRKIRYEKNLKTVFNKKLDIFCKSFIEEYVKIYNRTKRLLTEFNDSMGTSYLVSYEACKSLPIKNKEFFSLKTNYTFEMCNLLCEDLLNEGIYLSLSSYEEEDDKGVFIIKFTKTL